MSHPAVSVVVIFNSHLELLQKTLTHNIGVLTRPTDVPFEVILVADGSTQSCVQHLLPWFYEMPIDELRLRRRERHVAAGAPSNNAHLHNFKLSAPYLIVLEDDVLLFRTDDCFDVLAETIALFRRNPDVAVVSKMDDHGDWAWKLADLGPPIETGVRSVNRVATHFLAYDTARFLDAAGRSSMFDLDQFVDHSDCFNNWEDVVSRTATSGGRRIAYPERWPLLGFHCDEKLFPGSPYSTQDPETKLARCRQLMAGHDRSVS